LLSIGKQMEVNGCRQLSGYQRSSKKNPLVQNKGTHTGFEQHKGE